MRACPNGTIRQGGRRIGFSLNVTAAILFTAFIVIASVSYIAVTQGFDTVFSGLEKQSSNEEEIRNTAIAIEHLDWNKTDKNLHIYATNIGASTLKAGKVSVLVNGIDRTSNIAARSVDGISTDVWAPMNVLFLNLTNINAPFRITVITHNGVKAFAKPGLDHIYVSPPTATVPAGGTQIFVAQGYDFNDNPIDITTTLSWSTTVGTMSGATLNAQTTPGTGYVNASVGMIVGSARVNVTGAALDHIVVLPSTVDVPAGSTQLFTALGYDQFNNPVAIAPVWTTNVGVMAGATLVARQTPTGSGNVWATVGGVVGTALVNIIPSTLDHIIVTPDDVNVSVGGTQVYTATGYDIYNNPISIAPVWTTDVGYMMGNVFYAQTVQDDGIVTATIGAISDSVTVHVVAAALHHIHVNPTPIDVPAGTSYTFTATGHDAFNNVVVITPTWSTTLGTMAGNVLTAQTTPGNGYVNASVGTLVGTANVNIIPSTLDHIVVSPDPATVVAGGTRTFTAVGYDAYNNIVTINPIWTTNIGAMSNSLFYARTTPGVGTVTATVGAISDSAAVTITPGPLNHIHVIPSSADVPTGTSLDFDATGHDQYDNVVVIAPTWTSTLGTINAAGLFTAPNAIGTGTITATVGAISGTASVNIIPSNLVSITVTPSPQNVVAGTAFTFTATGYDAFGNVVAINPTWTTNVGTMAGPIFYARTTVGAGTVTATVGLISGLANVNVVAGPLNHIHVTPPAATIIAGGTQDFDATGHDQYDNPVTIAPTWTTTVGSVNAAGLVTVQNTVGAGTVTATVGAISGQGQITIIAAALDHIVVTPDPSTVTVGGAQAFTAVGYDAYNNPVTITPSWSTTVGTMSGNVFHAQTLPGTGTVTATVGATSDSAFVTVVVGSVAHYHVNPVASAKYAGFPFQVTIVAHDQFDNIVTTDSTTVVSFSSPSATMQFSTNGGGTWTATSATLTNGQVTFLARDTTAGTTTISAIDASMHSGVSGPIVILAGTPSSVTITSPIAATTVSADAHSITIACIVRDAFGNLVADGTAVTWTYTGASSIISPTYTTGGQATTVLTTTTVSGSVYTVTATSGAGSATSPSITVIPGSPAQVMPISPPSPMTVSADANTIAVSFKVMDAWGNDVANGVTVNFASSAGGSVSPVSDTTVSGLVSTTLTTSTVAGASFRVTATCNGISVDSQPVIVVPGLASLLMITSPLSATDVSADVHLISIICEVDDAFGNPVADGTQVTWTYNSASAGAVVSPTTTSGGVSATTLATSTTAGATYTVTATSNGASATSPTITVISGAVAFITPISPASSTTISADVASISTTFFVSDAWGNPVANGNVVTFTPSAGGSTLPVSAATAGGFASTTLTTSTNAGEVFRVSASCGGHIMDSYPITVVAGAPSLIIFSSPSSSVSVSADVHQYLIQASIKDAFGNPVADGTGVTFAINDPGLANVGLGSISSPVATVGGIASAMLVTSTVAGDDFKVAATSGTASADSDTITVVAGAISKLVFTTAAQSGISAGATSAICTVEAQDQYGNSVNVASDTTLALSSTSATTDFSYDGVTWGATTIILGSGSSSASFYFRDTTVGTITITVSESPSEGWNDATQIEQIVP